MLAERAFEVTWGRLLLIANCGDQNVPVTAPAEKPLWTNGAPGSPELAASLLYQAGITNHDQLVLMVAIAAISTLAMLMPVPAQATPQDRTPSPS